MEKIVILREAFNIFFDDMEQEEFICERMVIVKNKNYAEDVVPNFSDKTFKQHFRMKPEVFEVLCRDIHDFETHIYGPGRNSILLEKQLMITLWYLGNQEAMRSIADRFGVCITSVWRIVSWTCGVLIKLNRLRKYIKWPTSSERHKTSSCYLNKTRFPGIIGSIDGSHIPIRSPIISHNSYVNRKNFHFILLQGICNENLEFLYCYTGDPGSIHDAMLLRRSGLIDKLNSGQFNIDADQHLLGDSAYPIKEWLITPFKDHGSLTDEQKIFNRVHSKCRVAIERAFGLLKGRFRRLFYIDSLKPHLLVSYVIASCILHNICLQNDDLEEEFIVVEDFEEYENDDPTNDSQAGQLKRNNLTNSLF